LQRFLAQQGLEAVTHSHQVLSRLPADIAHPLCSSMAERLQKSSMVFKKIISTKFVVAIYTCMSISLS
jgi:hypothetical protein